VKAPFPWFGGKSKVASVVWDALGDVDNYVEPFFGSGAVLLARPDTHKWWERTETVNDLDGYVANFWRSVQAEPDAVAHHADWPVNENDLHARHAWLIGQRDSLQAQLEGDPGFYDAKVAGWWVWGLCLWIGSGWCSGKGPWRVVEGQLVHLGDDGQGINRKLVHLGDNGQGINRKLVHLGDNGQGLQEAWRQHLHQMMERLQDRLRRVRVCSGDWSRVCGPTPTVKLGLTGVFLDPPYSHAERNSDLYRVEMSTAETVRDWAIAHGADKRMRIALCGYGGEHDMPGWTAHEWKASGGYGSQGDSRGRANAGREVIWFSPHCLVDTARQSTLF